MDKRTADLKVGDSVWTMMPLNGKTGRAVLGTLLEFKNVQPFYEEQIIVKALVQFEENLKEWIAIESLVKINARTNRR
jgi:hypothetical protein